MLYIGKYTVCIETAINGWELQSYIGFLTVLTRIRFVLAACAEVGALHLGLWGAGGGQAAPTQQGQRERCHTAGGREVQHRARQRLGLAEMVFWMGIMDQKWLKWLKTHNIQNQVSKIWRVKWWIVGQELIIRTPILIHIRRTFLTDVMPAAPGKRKLMRPTCVRMLA